MLFYSVVCWRLLLLNFSVIVSARRDEVGMRLHYHSLLQAAKGKKGSLKMFSEGEQTKNNGLNFRNICRGVRKALGE